MVWNEIKVWKMLGKHPNIVELFDYATIVEDGGKFVIILMELCPDGHLLDLLEWHGGKLSENAIIKVLS